MSPLPARAEVVVPCVELSATIDFFVEQLGFRLETISPADDPTAAVISGHGLRVLLDRHATGSPGTIRVLVDEHGLDEHGFDVRGGELIAPNGTRIELGPIDPPVVVPPLQSSYVVSRATSEVAWVMGRAGMQYRDLIPGRHGGRFIASHIRIAEGGPVPDYVHFHRIRFQMIFCHRGWVRVVYEGQGAPFVMQAGECVLQPPGIRHRVLESSAGLEVVEIACPAAHETVVDHEIELPTAEIQPARRFGGQRFVRHAAGTATWTPWWADGLVSCELGIEGATDGLASAHLVRSGPECVATQIENDAELLLLFVRSGRLDVQLGGRPADTLGAGDSVALPRGEGFALHRCSNDMELLVVRLGAATSAV
jgi:quercetin dioxygenase-like cupin family protein